MYKNERKYYYKDKLLITKHNKYGCSYHQIFTKNNKSFIFKSYRVNGKLHNK